jgi:hypothetical protein
MERAKNIYGWSEKLKSRQSSLCCCKLLILLLLLPTLMLKSLMFEAIVLDDVANAAVGIVEVVVAVTSVDVIVFELL